MAEPGAQAQAETPTAPAGRTLVPGRQRLFYHSLLDFLRDLPGAERRFWTLVIVTGAAAGLGAVLLIEILSAVQSLAWPAGASLLEQVHKASPLHRFAVLTLGGLGVSLAAWLLRRPLGGHGTAGIIEAIWMRAGHFSLLRAFVNGLAAIVVVGLGAPLGREGALMSSGAAVGSFLATRLKLRDEQTRVLVACGAASGIAAAYNVPVGGALFGLEVLLGSFALEFFGPIVVSCVVATLVSRALLENHPAYEIPYYRLGTPAEMARLVLLAPLLGVASAFFVRVVELFAAIGDRAVRRGVWMLPTAAMAFVGLLAWKWPQVLGNGYDAVNMSLLGKLPLTLLIVLPLVKLLATAVCSGAGVPGGLFTPSLFYGALLGGALGQLVDLAFPSAAPSGAYALVGMAATLAGTTHAAVSAVLIIFEMTRDYGAILPLMLGCVVATAVSRSIESSSLYTGVLLRRGVTLPERPKPQWAQSTRVKTLLVAEVQTVSPATPFEEVVMRLLELKPGNDLYVVSKGGTYLGAVVLDALKGHIPDRTLLPSVIAADVMDTQLAPLTEGMSLAEAAKRLAGTYLDKLPVVDSERRLVGTLSKQDVVSRGVF